MSIIPSASCIGGGAASRGVSDRPNVELLRRIIKKVGAAARFYSEMPVKGSRIWRLNNASATAEFKSYNCLLFLPETIDLSESGSGVTLTATLKTRLERHLALIK